MLTFRSLSGSGAQIKEAIWASLLFSVTIIYLVISFATAILNIHKNLSCNIESTMYNLALATIVVISGLPL